MDRLLNQDGTRLFPMGLHFVPTDKELLIYLKKKINGEPVAYEFMCSTNVYKKDPQELTEAYPSFGMNGWYFYTPRDRRYLNGNRPNRTTGTGYWKATAAGKPIHDHNNVCIGSKRSLVFYEGNSTKGKKTNWLMQEYMIVQPSNQHRATNNMLLDTYVLCRIYANSRRYTNVEEDAAATSCRIQEQENNKSFESGNEGQQTLRIQGQQDIDLMVQQQNYLMMQQHNFSMPTDQIGGPLPYSFGSTSDNNDQIYNMENLEQQDIDLMVQQQNYLMMQQHNFSMPTDQIGGPLPYSFGSTSDNNDQIYNMENLENAFLVDLEPGTAQNIDNFTPCTLMDSFGPSAYNMDDLWEELSNEKK